MKILVILLFGSVFFSCLEFVDSPVFVSVETEDPVDLDPRDQYLEQYISTSWQTVDWHVDDGVSLITISTPSFNGIEGGEKVRYFAKRDTTLKVSGSFTTANDHSAIALYLYSSPSKASTTFSNIDSVTSASTNSTVPINDTFYLEAGKVYRFNLDIYDGNSSQHYPNVYANFEFEIVP